MEPDIGDGVVWDGPTPVSTRFADPYYAKTDGAAEAAHVFLAGNGLPERLHPGFHIAELGFGTGLNLMVTVLAAPKTPFRFTSFEAYPLSAAEMAQALARWPRIAAAAAPMLDAVAAGVTRFRLGAAEVTLILGDARRTLPAWPGRADAWYLDGFAPARNPELWGADLLTAVAAKTAPGGTLATYTAAGHVRRALAGAGFTVARRPGFGTKRHMTTGSL